MHSLQLTTNDGKLLGKRAAIALNTTSSDAGGTYLASDIASLAEAEAQIDRLQLELNALRFKAREFFK